MPIWILSEEGTVYARVEARGAKEALEIARANVDPDNYPDHDTHQTPTASIWIEIAAWCEETGEEISDTVTCEPDEPECSHADGHDWASGRDTINEAGVIISEVCAHCGVRRVTNTWARNPDTNAQGLHSVRYSH